MKKLYDVFPTSCMIKTKLVWASIVSFYTLVNYHG
jgi:hypothetical protein